MKLIALGDQCIDLYRNTGAAFPGGNAVNTAVLASECGAESEYLGVFGTDLMAEVLRQALLEKHVDISRCPVLPGRTTKACLYRVTDGERNFLDVKTGPHWTGAIRLTARELQHLATADILISGCNAKLPEQIAAVAQLPPVFAFDFGEKEKYRTDAYFDEVCASGMDLAMFSCEEMSETDFRSFADRLHFRHVRHVLITMGAAGQMLSNGEEICRYRPEPVHAVDTMGAGDAFLAGFTVSLKSMGWQKGRTMPAAALHAAMEAGSRAAAANCLREGGIGLKVTLTEEQILAWELQLE